MALVLAELSVDRMVSAVEKVRERLLRSTAALENAGINYAVAGGNAVAAWVARTDEGGIRNTPDVDFLLRRADLPAAEAALEQAGLRVTQDGCGRRDRTTVHVIFAGEKVRPQELLPNPDVAASEQDTLFRVLTLEALVHTKLTAFRTIDRVHLRDILDVGLIDDTWKARYPPELAERLQLLIDTPDG